MIKRYLDAISEAQKRGNATEHTHRAALQALLEASDASIAATNEPRRIGGNAPDLILQRGSTPVGCIETKAVDEPLNRILNSDQLKRYRAALPNLILTDYLEFIWLKEGVEEARIRLGRWDGERIAPEKGNRRRWNDFLHLFLNDPALTVDDPNRLAELLAAQTRLLKEATLTLLPQADRHSKELDDCRKTFEKVLLPDLQEAQFADMFAQTIAYGLFTARCLDETPEAFSRAEAARLIPHANPFLRRFFDYVAGVNLHPALHWLVDEMVALLARADMEAILLRHGARRGYEDPVFHFYETFLAAYDARLRERRGVYYTPEPVVDFIVRAVDRLLETEFQRRDGLADRDTLILDPAAGTATFLRAVVRRIRERIAARGQAGLWTVYARDHLLPRLFGFELMMAPYTIAHLKLALEMKAAGFQLGPDQRFNIFLTNALERLEGETGNLLAQWLSEEAESAEAVKNDRPVQVVLGNPPYSGHSANPSKWLDELLKDYKKEPDGGKLKERNPKWINDDYVKFIRFAHWRVVKSGHGIVAYIANHGWLDNPTFRGMRAALLRDFDRIYIADLHGNAKRRERTPEGGADQNVFDIQQGVALLFLVRLPEHDDARPAKLLHTDLWGTRDAKYDALEGNDLESLGWQEIAPRAPLLLFRPVDEKRRAEYQRGWKLTDIFPLHSVGVVTSRDKFALDFDRETLERRISDFIDPDQEESVVRARYFGEKARNGYRPGDNRDWQMTKARNALQKDVAWREAITPYLYRPFDTRFLLYHRAATDFGRREVIRHLQVGENIALIFMRQVSVSGEYSHIGITNAPTDGRYFYSNRGIMNLAPLYLYPDNSKSAYNVQRDFFLPNGKGRIPNLNPDLIAELEKRLALKFDSTRAEAAAGTFTPYTLFHYLYAVLHAPTYRQRYGEYLQSDFPRVPPPADADHFFRLAELGRQLTDAHLLRLKVDLQTAIHYPIDGSHVVERPRYTESDGRIHINATQYFERVAAEEWAFRIGGYQALQKWLKDRKGRRLDYDDLVHYERMVAAIRATRRLMGEIDAATAPLFDA